MSKSFLAAHSCRLACATLVALAAVPASRLRAQTTTTPGARLTLTDVYRWADGALPGVEAARARVRAAEARTRAATVPADPLVSLGAMNRELPGLGPMRPLNMTQLQATQMFPWPGKLRLAETVAERQADALRERGRGLQQEVRASAAGAFFDLYVADRSLALARENQALLRDIRESARAMYSAGRGRQSDILRTEVEIGRMAEEIIRMQTMRRVALSRLGTTLNRTIDSSVVPEAPRLPHEVPPLDSLLARALDARAELRAGRADVSAADAARLLAQREIWPDLELTVQYGQRPGEAGMSTERMGSLMIGATLPVFGRSRQLRMREEALAMRDMATAELQGMLAETRHRVVAAHAELEQNRQLLELYRQTLLPTAQATLESALASYRVGGADFMTLLESQMALIRLRQSVLDVEAVSARSYTELEMLLGRDLIPALDANGRPNDQETRR
jgi:outer membrane protein TolC